VELRDADIGWAAEDDDLETAAEELKADLLNSLASIAEPDRMVAGIPGIDTRDGLIWAEHGPPNPRFEPGFADPR
jgi:hypothetical protein